MDSTLRHRTNDEWLAALEGGDAESVAALAELHAYLLRVLRKVFRSDSGLSDHDLSDLVQEASLRLIEYRHTFRAESSFPTWATAVATRVAFTELRKRRVRERGATEFEEIRRAALERPDVTDVEEKRELLGALGEAIERELTDRQRIAILAELRGVPTVEIAARLETNSNALYKLVHDARRKLRDALIARGYSAEFIRDSVEGAHR